MRTFRRLAVYCGAAGATVPRYGELARAVGTELALKGIGVVYGGGSVGLMGALADGAMEAGGEVIGVIPERLDALELGHRGITDLQVVPDMHSRKARMAELADGFIALPGGYGTWEELFEVTTWTQLGYHRKPVGVLNARGYYDHLLAQIRHGIEEGFVQEAVSHIICASGELGELLEMMGSVELPVTEKWIRNP